MRLRRTDGVRVCVMVMFGGGCRRGLDTVCQQADAGVPLHPVGSRLDVADCRGHGFCGLHPIDDDVQPSSLPLQELCQRSGHLRATGKRRRRRLRRLRQGAVLRVVGFISEGWMIACARARVPAQSTYALDRFLYGTQGDAIEDTPGFYRWNGATRNPATGTTTVARMHSSPGSGISEDHAGADVWVDIWNGVDAKDTADKCMWAEMKGWGWGSARRLLAAVL